jgi:LmbE family N-acetylglucosaminyl deacetylase
VNELPPGRIVVVSPHLDDGVLSLGGSIARAASRGSDVTVLTVMACDPDSSAPASDWDRAGGFRTEGEAARARREEDRAACGRVGAKPEWLPFGDMTYERHGTDDEMHRAVTEATGGADLVLLPGFPLVHPDHAHVARLLLQRGLAPPIACYVEQPYVVTRRSWRPWLWPYRPGLAEAIDGVAPETPAWGTIRLPFRARLGKLRACRAYRTQLPLIGRYPPVLLRMGIYESVKGGETVGSMRSSNHRS